MSCELPLEKVNGPAAVPVHRAVCGGCEEVDAVGTAVELGDSGRVSLPRRLRSSHGALAVREVDGDESPEACCYAALQWATVSVQSFHLHDSHDTTSGIIHSVCTRLVWLLT